ncbi:hypothetical protein GCM10010344_15290 [Streptomyces bluensis]|nr:hypothetical protein GCM10010344_15290 [Streptomyces bluensis]
MRHPLVGALTLSHETMKLPDDHEQALIIHQAEPGSPSAEALRPLAGWGTDAMSAGAARQV